MGCKKLFQAWCALLCEDVQTLDHSPSPPRYPHPARRSLAPRARVPQVVTTVPSAAHLRGEQPADAFPPHPSSPPQAAPPRARPASLFAGRDEIELRPLVGSLPSAFSSFSSVTSTTTTVEDDNNTIVDGGQPPPVASFSRWSWPLTSPEEDSISWVSRLREHRPLLRTPRRASWVMACEQALKKTASSPA